MAAPDSRPQLVSGLECANGEAFDRAMDRRIDVNETGEFIMERMDGTTPVSRIAADLAERYGIPGKTALEDTVAFVDSLRACGLVNVRYPAGYYLRTALGVAFRPNAASFEDFRSLFLARKRADICGGLLASIVAQVGLRLCSRHLSLVLYLTILCGGFIFVLLGKLVYAALIPALVSCVSLLGMSLHEGAHLYALRRCSGDDRLGYLRLAPMEMGIGYPYVRPDLSFRVAMAGPLLPTVCGAALYLVNAFYPNPLLAVAALLLVAHVLSFLPFSGSDGRNLLSYATVPREGEERTAALEIDKNLRRKVGA